jgi:transitional endoplasmic reticulum ATPase
MAATSKPLLHGGFVVASGVSVVRRVECIFFTEVYELSNSAYLYVFVKVRPEDVAGREEKYGLRRIIVAGRTYLSLIVSEHSREKVFGLAESISSVRGFDAVAGMRELKKRLINDVINPLRNPEKYREFKLSIPNGILLYGPPGCGKTFIVKKLAEELGYSFVVLSPSSVATPYVHGAVGNIASVFETARREAPAIVFIDEIEGLLPKREELGSWADIKKEEINEFLLQLNNAGESKILVIGATNRPQMIDTAILRSGRMDKRIFVPPPDFDARKEMIRMCLAGRPYDDTIDFDALARATENFVGSDIELIVTEAAREAVLGDKTRIDEQMIAGVIARFPPSISPEEIGQYKQFSNLERW